MGSKILTKTDRAMEDTSARGGADTEPPTRCQGALVQAHRLELAEALTRCADKRLWEKWGFSDFDAYCRKELHLKGSTVAKLLGSYRFLESSAPRVIERARTDHFESPIPSLATVDFVQRATEKGKADEETLQTIHRVAFEEGAEAPVLKSKFGEVVFPVSAGEKKEKLRAQITATARRLSALIAEDGAPIPKQLAIRVEEVVGDLLETLEN